MNEHWKDIDGYEGFYQVSNLGRVKSLARTVHTVSRTGNSYTKQVKERVMKQDTFGRYPLIELRTPGGKSKKYSVHRLVAIAFLGDRPGFHVNHINGVKDDNRVDNLEWVTPSENIRHAYGLGLAETIKGEAHINSKLTADDVVYIRENKGVIKQKDLGNLFGITQAHVSAIQSGKRWSHLDA